MVHLQWAACGWPWNCCGGWALGSCSPCHSALKETYSFGLPRPMEMLMPAFLLGWRIGKGEGYADLEYAMMVSMGAVHEGTPVVTIVHDCQVLPASWSPGLLTASCCEQGVGVLRGGRTAGGAEAEPHPVGMVLLQPPSRSCQGTRARLCSLARQLFPSVSPRWWTFPRRSSRTTTSPWTTSSPQPGPSPRAAGAPSQRGSPGPRWVIAAAGSGEQGAPLQRPSGRPLWVLWCGSRQSHLWSSNS